MKGVIIRYITPLHRACLMPSIGTRKLDAPSNWESAAIAVIERVIPFPFWFLELRHGACSGRWNIILFLTLYKNKVLYVINWY